jgi:hypothetical protein
MSLLGVSLTHAREVPTRPVMEGVLVSSEGETPGVACACQRAALPPATPTEGHRHGTAWAPIVPNDGTTHAGGRRGRAWWHCTG